LAPSNPKESFSLETSKLQDRKKSDVYIYVYISAKKLQTISKCPSRITERGGKGGNTKIKEEERFEDCFIL